MRWIAYFEDHAGREWIRKEHAAAHFDYVASERDKIRLGGLCLLVWGKAPCYEAVTL
jgi:hypothetical protein